MRPWEFWELTLAEFNVMIDSYLWLDYQENAKLAKHARWVMSAHVKENKIPAIEKMIGKPPKTEADKKKEKEEKPVTAKQDLEDMKKNMGMG
ncbi:hypothetical protein HUG15_05750 [Salicibibacter cibarius]|uniref:Uncharacterized protein n=2 Tax=Salicibibacter cibarius TaxID=2743000 RepID=A0A7T6Z1E7_9BACI|nr:hypothetical protein HUG15_05415 [Salicibibacter cibarius]QQK75158.1 hypothetical protein HUG15_05750 [Salicibibacter cibarius]